MTRNEGLLKLRTECHPACRDRFIGFYASLETDYDFIRPFEVARTPEKQEDHWLAGNSKVRAWRSVHQYGWAVDFVPFLSGHFTWKWDGWKGLHTRAENFGLHAPISWDKPHIVVIGWKEQFIRWLGFNQFT